MLEKKCNHAGCNNIIVDVNKKTKALKKFCSNKCRYSDHSRAMTQHPQIADAPLCKSEECSATVSKKTTGQWKIYCSPQCQNVDVAFRKSDFFGVLPPKCKSLTCVNLVPKGRNGHWNIYCSQKCSSKNNSILSRQRSASTYESRTGYTNPSLNPDVISKIQHTKKTIYGDFDSPGLSNLSTTSKDKLFSKEWLQEQNLTRTLNHIAAELGISPSSLGVRFKNFNLTPTFAASSSISMFEKEIRDYIASLGVTTKCNDRSIISPKELDIYIPSLNLAIECNGTYWHSENQGKNKNYHLDKTIRCKSNGVDLFHISNVEWETKQEIIKSMISAKLGKSTRLYARQCKIKEISSTVSTSFLKENHVQGDCKSSVRIGLFHNNVLVSVMTFGRPRYAKHDYELHRFCNILNTSVVGGASKLFKYFVKFFNPISIISYSHRDKFTGNLYSQLGFNFSHSSGPAYYYTKNYLDFENRLKYQKHKLIKILPIFNPLATEWENMQENGYDRIWDCGNDVWVWSKILNNIDK